MPPNTILSIGAAELPAELSQNGIISIPVSAWVAAGGTLRGRAAQLTPAPDEQQGEEEKQNSEDGEDVPLAPAETSPLTGVESPASRSSDTEEAEKPWTEVRRRRAAPKPEEPPQREVR